MIGESGWNLELEVEKKSNRRYEKYLGVNMMPIDWLYMREEKREDEAEDSGINDDDYVTSLGNYAEGGVMMTLKNVRLGL